MMHLLSMFSRGGPRGRGRGMPPFMRGRGRGAPRGGGPPERIQQGERTAAAPTEAKTDEPSKA